MDVERKLQVLSKMAEELNKENITWAIGASLLLYIKGKVSDFHDIDIMVSEEDAEKLRRVLLTLGKIQLPNLNMQYKTKYFFEFVIDGIDVDVMGGFTIVNNNKAYYFPLKKEEIIEYTYINSQRIPLQSLAEWKLYYSRDSKNVFPIF